MSLESKSFASLIGPTDYVLTDKRDIDNMVITAEGFIYELPRGEASFDTMRSACTEVLLSFANTSQYFPPLLHI